MTQAVDPTMNADASHGGLTRAYANFAGAMFFCGVFGARMLEAAFVSVIPQRPLAVSILLMALALGWAFVCWRRLGQRAREDGAVRVSLARNMRNAAMMFIPLGLVLGPLSRVAQHFAASGTISNNVIAQMIMAGSFIGAIILGLVTAHNWAKRQTNAPG